MCGTYIQKLCCEPDSLVVLESLKYLVVGLIANNFRAGEL
jgi:hypothetical protein